MGNTYKKAIEETAAHFKYKKRGTGDDAETISVLKDTAPETLRESLHEAHGDRLPDDWIYDKYHAILSDLSGYTITSNEDLEENRHEIVDGLVDIYNTDRTAWLARHLGNAAYCDDAALEYDGVNADILASIGLGQYYAIDQIYGHVVSYLESVVDAEGSAQ